MKEFFKKRKKLIIEILITLGILLIISGITLAILYGCGVIYFDGGIKFHVELFDSFKNSWYGWIIFILLQTILTMLLCFIPGISMAFIMLSTQIYENQLVAFTLSFVSVMISSMTMYILGRVGGYKLCVKWLGEEDCEKSLGLLRNRGTVYFPLMMMFPIFPDDALVMIAGTLKMKLKWFIPSIVIGRGIGIFTIVYGISIIPFDKFTSLYDWLILATIIAFWVILIFKAAHKLDEKLNKKQLTEEKKPETVEVSE